MSSKRTQTNSAAFGSLAEWICRRDQLPRSVRSVLRYYSHTGVFDATALRIRGWVDETVDGYIEDAFSTVENRLEGEFNHSDVNFSYETKLTLPVELTVGYIYRRAVAESSDEINPVTGGVKTPITEYFRIPYDKKHESRRRERLEREAADQIDLVSHAEDVARLCTEAVIDGDMRDAINDKEFDDFEVNFEVSHEERALVAEIAQECLRDRVEKHLSEFPEAVAEQYETAKQKSETHQKEDEVFRELMRQARNGSEEAVEKIKTEYKHSPFDSPPEVLPEEEREWPYCRTQYERVGVIYDGMIEMFRAAGIDIEPEFKHAVVLAIIGAQIWLDDIDDFSADMEEGQLTPVTAEYLIQDSSREAYENITDISQQYLDRAVEESVRSNSHLTGIATEYIYLSGDPSVLPGSERSS